MGWVTMVETLKTIDTNSSHVKINVDKKRGKYLAHEVLVGWVAQEAGTHSKASSWPQARLHGGTVFSCQVLPLRKSCQ